MQADTSGRNEPIVCIGEFRLDLPLRSLHRGADRVQLTPKSFSTLELLVQNRHRVVTKTELLEKVWGGRREISTVEHVVCNLRRALGDDAGQPRYIETEPGGYHFIADVRYAVDPAASAVDGHIADAMLRLPARRWLRYYALGALVFVGIATAAAIIFRSPGLPERVSIAGSTLSAWDDRGRILWEHHFGQPMRTLSPEEQTWRVRLVDLDGDGRREILAILAFPLGKEHDREELYCFASNGELLWQYKPEHELKFVSRSFSGPWQFEDMAVVPVGKHQDVWVSVADEVWWPSLLVSIEPNGNRKVRLVSSGVVYALHVVQNGDSAFVLAGGINNEYRKASLAVLQSEQAPATSPQTAGNGYQCLECPAGHPYRYFLFPRSEINVAAGRPYNEIFSVRPYNGRILLYSNEGVDGHSMRALYEMTADLVPQSVSYCEGYKERHLLLERSKQIGHAWKDCKEQKAPAIVQSWDSAHGWRNLPVPWVH